MSADYETLNEDEIKARIVAKQKELQALHRQQASSTTPASTASPAKPSSFAWLKPKKSPSLGVFLMPLLFLYHARDQMSTTNILLAVTCCLVCGYIGHLIVDYVEHSDWRQRLSQEAEAKCKAEKDAHEATTGKGAKKRQ